MVTKPSAALYGLSMIHWLCMEYSVERDPELSWKKRLSAICHLIKCSVVSKGKGGQSSNSFIMTAFVCLKECFAEVGGEKGRCGIVTLLSDFILFPFGVMLQALVWLKNVFIFGKHAIQQLTSDS